MYRSVTFLSCQFNHCGTFLPSCKTATVFLRHYANHVPDPDKSGDASSEEADAEVKRIINAYPKTPNASPYEIMNVSNSVTPKDLKKQFYKLAKIYHPDTNAHEDKKDTEKDERFKKILAAYSLLKNPITKNNYDKYKIGWNDNVNLRTNANMYTPGTHAYNNFTSNTHKSNFTSYETGTWEDRYRGDYGSSYGYYKDSNWSSSQTGDLKEEFKKNRKTILLSTVFTLGIYTALQLSLTYLYDDDHFNESISSIVVNTHERSEEDLFHAYTNYGLGDSKQDRINRFLWWRKLTMALNLADVREVLDHFYKGGVVENYDDPKSQKQVVRLKEFK